MIRQTVSPLPAMRITRRLLQRGGAPYLLRLTLTVSLACAFWIPRATDLRNLELLTSLRVPWKLLGIEDPVVQAQIRADLLPWMPWMAALIAAALAVALVVGARASGVLVDAAAEPHFQVRESWKRVRGACRGYLVLLAILAAIGLAGRWGLSDAGFSARAASLLAFGSSVILLAAREIALPLAVIQDDSFRHGAKAGWRATRFHPTAVVVLLLIRGLLGWLLAWTWGLLAAVLAAFPAALAALGGLLLTRWLADAFLGAPDALLTVLAFVVSCLVCAGITAAALFGFALYAPAALFLRVYTLRGTLRLTGRPEPSGWV